MKQFINRLWPWSKFLAYEQTLNAQACALRSQDQVIGGHENSMRAWEAKAEDLQAKLTHALNVHKQHEKRNAQLATQNKNLELSWTQADQQIKSLSAKLHALSMPPAPPPPPPSPPAAAPLEPSEDEFLGVQWPFPGMY